MAKTSERYGLPLSVSGRSTTMPCCANPRRHAYIPTRSGWLYLAVLIDLDALTAHRMLQSMSRKGDCWDDAVAESVFATLEHELLTGTVLPSHRAANAAIYDFIEHWYNPERQHSTLQNLSPMQYEQQRRQMAQTE